MKRRGRKARFEGATSKYVGMSTGKPTPNGLSYLVPVGPVSLSKTVINTGRGPNQERIAEYYNRIRDWKPLPSLGTKKIIVEEVFETKTLQEDGRYLIGQSTRRVNLTEEYGKILEECKEMHIALVPDCHLGRTDLFFKSGSNEWFIVDIDYKTRTFRRSRIYGRKETAIDRWKNNRVTWVERIAPQ